MNTTLPTLDVSDEAYERVINAFGGADSFRAWLKENVVNYILNTESWARRMEFESSESEIFGVQYESLLECLTYEGAPKATSEESTPTE